MKQGTKTLAVKTTRKAEHFWVFYFQIQQKFSTHVGHFLSMLDIFTTDRKDCLDISYSTS